MRNLILLICLTVGPALGQVPRVCVQNATQPNSVCCPSIPGGVSSAPCGGPSRGLCMVVKMMINGDLRNPVGPVPSDVHDNRMDWPAHIFQKVCECNPLYHGYACQHSRLDRPERPWSTGNRRVRKNAATLTKEERLHVRDVLVKSRQQMSDWVILDDTVTGRNPDGSKKITYFNVSIYDYYIFLNYYASKGLNFNPLKPTPPSLADLVHRSINVLPWHRYFLSAFERDVDGIHRNLTLAKNPLAISVAPFALPYWDWTDQKLCEPCTDDLVGAIDEQNARGLLSPASPFASWEVLCNNIEPVGHPCDPRGPRPKLWRTYNKDPLYNTLPTAAELKFTMEAPFYDLDPCTEMANASSFRNLLEGFIGSDNNFTAQKAGKRFMGMQVRHFIQGTWTNLALGPNDPLFWLHQAFLDKLFAEWGAKAPRGAVGLPPGFPAWPGENRTENFAPFLPPVTIGAAERLWGPYAVNYDNSLRPPQGIAKTVDSPKTAGSTLSPSRLIGPLVLAFVGCAIGVIVIAYLRKRRVRMFVEVKDPEKQPLL